MTTPPPMRALSERAAAARSYAAVERRLAAYADRHTLTHEQAGRLGQLIEQCQEADS